MIYRILQTIGETLVQATGCFLLGITPAILPLARPSAGGLSPRVAAPCETQPCLESAREGVYLCPSTGKDKVTLTHYFTESSRTIYKKQKKTKQNTKIQKVLRFVYGLTASGRLGNHRSLTFQSFKWQLCRKESLRGDLEILCGGNQIANDSSEFYGGCEKAAPESITISCELWPACLSSWNDPGVYPGPEMFCVHLQLVFLLEINTF